jgi:predicted 3-demethylubiquinone-9 3-methyltransferase (glyoxalase superfamily)
MAARQGLMEMRNTVMEKITTCLWFVSQAEEAAEFYVSVFDDAKVLNVARYGEAGPGPAGQAITVQFQIEGRTFTALNGGPALAFTEAVSFVIDCSSQEEVDRYWAALTDGGFEGQCGWLKDRYGVSWQVVPWVLGQLIGGPDSEGAQRAMQAMLGMRKLDIATLEQAYYGS